MAVVGGGMGGNSEEEARRDGTGVHVHLYRMHTPQYTQVHLLRKGTLQYIICSTLQYTLVHCGTIW